MRGIACKRKNFIKPIGEIESALDSYAHGELASDKIIVKYLKRELNKSILHSDV
jgi:hypothetical protein